MLQRDTNIIINNFLSNAYLQNMEKYIKIDYFERHSFSLYSVYVEFILRGKKHQEYRNKKVL